MPTFQSLEHSSLRLRTTDEDLLVDAAYNKVIKIITHLWNSNIIQRGSGYCVSMSDMVRILLNQEGIDCDLVECKLTVMSKDPPGLFLIGHSGQISNFHQELDTHVVVITKTPKPMLIDLSIYGVLPNLVPYICEKVTNTSSEDILNLDLGHSTWIYKIKEINKIPRMYQKSIVDRFKTDRSVQRSLTFLKIWIIIITIVSTLNALRGAYDFYHVHVVKDVAYDYIEDNK